MNKSQQHRFNDASISMMETMASQAAATGEVSEMQSAAFAAIGANVVQTQNQTIAEAIENKLQTIIDANPTYSITDRILGRK